MGPQSLMRAYADRAPLDKRSDELQQAALEQFPIIPYQERCSRPDGRCPQLPRAAEKHPQKLVVRGPHVCQIEVNYLASFGHVKTFDPLESLQRAVAGDRLLRCVLNHAVADPVLRKKLLRALATRSARAVIPPLERLGRRAHRLPSWSGLLVGLFRVLVLALSTRKITLLDYVLLVAPGRSVREVYDCGIDQK